MNTNSTLINEEYLKYENSDGSDENYNEEGELEIDLDYDDFVDVKNIESDIPLDLSMKPKTQNDDDKKAKLPTINIQPNFNMSDFANNNVTTAHTDKKGRTITEKEVIQLLDPYIKSVHKKFSCTVCDMKFATKVKAVTHVENKHVDCLQYKCPLCRGSKGTRLAYESHLRRGHGAKVKDYSPRIRSKRMFSVKSEIQISNIETQSGQPYDLEFVTFLRHILSLGQELDQSRPSWHKAIHCAEWINQDQGIFGINNKHEFTMRWYSFKVIENARPPQFHFMFQGVNCEPWDSLYSTVIVEFIKRNIFKKLSSNLVFQVFSIKQLLK